MRRALIALVSLAFLCASVGCSKDKRERKRKKDRDDDEQVEREDDRDEAEDRDRDRSPRSSRQPGLLAKMLGAEDPVVQEFKAACDAVCACRDTTCAQAKMTAIYSLMKAYQDRKVSKGDAERIEADTKRAAKCVAALVKR